MKNREGVMSLAEIRCRAAVLTRFGAPPEVREVVVPPPGPGDVRVRLMASGVCHSDLHVMQGDWEQPLPIVPGHEGAGIVESVGANVSTVAPGDHVVLSWNANCRVCKQCSLGRPYLCERAIETIARSVSLDGRTRLRDLDGAALHSYLAVGTFSEYTVVPESAAIRIRADAPFDRAALVGCAVATGVGAALNTARVAPGSAVAVIGCGGVGLSIIQGARLQACAPIIGVDRIAAKLELARQMGATETVLASAETDVVAEVRRLSEGGVDYAFEAIGLIPTLRQALACLRPGGTGVVVGLPKTGESVSIEPLPLAELGLSLLGSNYGSTRPSIDFPQLIDWYMRGMLYLDPLIARRFALQEIGAAFDLLKTGRAARGVVIYEA
jgi:S-(hydroxymethyl)glutathione dehydrogenase/alcohol dehydrogenase